MYPECASRSGEVLALRLFVGVAEQEELELGAALDRVPGGRGALDLTREDLAGETSTGSPVFSSSRSHSTSAVFSSHGMCRMVDTSGRHTKSP